MKSKYWNNSELDVLQAEALAELATPSSDGFMSAFDKTILDAATASYTSDTLIKRDASGRAQVVNPSAAQDIATKNYVDNAIGDAIGAAIGGSY